MPVSSDTSYAKHYTHLELPSDARYAMDSSNVSIRHAGSPMSCTVQLEITSSLVGFISYDAVESTHLQLLIFCRVHLGKSKLLERRPCIQAQ